MLTMTDRIAKTPEIVGGRARIAGSRIAVWGLVAYQRLGLSDDQLLECYPQLTKEDLQAAWDYATIHPDEIDSDIRENDRDDDEVVE